MSVEAAKVSRIEKNIVIVTVIVLLFVTMILMILNTNSRIESLQDTLTRQPPGRFKAVDLASRYATDLDVSAAVLDKTVYVPVYSHIYHDDGKPYSLAATLSIRNTDDNSDMYVTGVRYYDTSGTLSRTDVDRPVRLRPMETLEFFVACSDSTGGSGANFIVEWLALERLTAPAIEAIMVGTAGTQAVCFARRGIELDSSQQ